MSQVYILYGVILFQMVVMVTMYLHVQACDKAYRTLRNENNYLRNEIDSIRSLVVVK